MLPSLIMRVLEKISRFFFIYFSKSPYIFFFKFFSMMYLFNSISLPSVTKFEIFLKLSKKVIIKYIKIIIKVKKKISFVFLS